MTASAYQPAALDFVDPISGRICTLSLDPIGVRHGDCPRLADVAVELDCFYCTTCRWNGRITGAWVVDLLKPTPDGLGADAGPF